jgi:predicted nuclease of predicted toxin-antitoxin system
MLPPLVADMDIAVPVVHFLRRHGVDVLSAREEGSGVLTDSQILARAHVMGRVVLTHDADFGTLAMHRGEPLTGIVYLRPGGRPPAQVMADLQALLEAEIDWTPPVIAVYRTGRLRLRRPAEEAWRVWSRRASAGFSNIFAENKHSTWFGEVMELPARYWYTTRRRRSHRTNASTSSCLPCRDVLAPKLRGTRSRCRAAITLGAGP